MVNMPDKVGDLKLRPEDKEFLYCLMISSINQYRVIIAVKDNPEKSNSTLAAEMGIPLNTFKTRLHRAREKITKWRWELRKLEIQIRVMEEQG